VKYFVTIGERIFTIDLAGQRVDVDGQAAEARLERVPGSPEVRVVIDGVASSLAVDSEQGGSWRLVEGGTVREVAVEDERARHIRLLAGAGPAVGRHAAIKAPMPGLVLRILVNTGDRVAAGAPLLALEAMKMENELKAPVAGLVSQVLVTAGQVVQKGQLLLEVTPAT
jgi:biotin carboxyl carrier protein